MLSLFLNRLAREREHFMKLSAAARRTLATNSVYEFCVPVTYLFVNTFLLRQTNDPTTVAWYNLTQFISTAVTFIINGYLFRRVSISSLFRLGMVLQGLVALPLFLFQPSSLWAIAAFGWLSGMGLGLYWANRNYFFLEYTHDEQRSYYAGLELTAVTSANIIVPLLVGWIIELGDYLAFYTADQAYQVLGVVVVGILAWGSTIIAGVSLPKPAPYHFSLTRNFSASWLFVRLISVFHGFKNSFDLFLGAIMVFYFFGKEGTFGSVSSVIAILTLIATYLVGRKLKVHQRVSLLVTENVLLLILTAVFAIVFEPWATIVYLLFAGLLREVAWIALTPIFMRAVDLEDAGRPDNNYYYLTDRELFLNLGRVAGIGLFFVMLEAVGTETSIRIIPFITAVLYLGVTGSSWWLAKMMNK